MFTYDHKKLKGQDWTTDPYFTTAERLDYRMVAVISGVLFLLGYHYHFEENNSGNKNHHS